MGNVFIYYCMIDNFFKILDRIVFIHFPFYVSSLDGQKQNFKLYVNLNTRREFFSFPFFSFFFIPFLSHSFSAFSLSLSRSSFRTENYTYKMLFHFKLLARPVVDYHAAANGSTVHCDTIYNPPRELQAHNTHFFFKTKRVY